MAIRIWRLMTILLAAAISAPALAGPTVECDAPTPTFDPITGGSGLWFHDAAAGTSRGAAMDGFTTVGTGDLPETFSSSYVLLGSPDTGFPDFDGNGISDVVMQHSGGYTYVFLMESDGASWLQIAAEGPIPGPLSSSYTTIGFPDLNGDGKSDICHQHSGGFTYCYLQDGLQTLGSGQIDGPFDTNYKTLGFPDLDGDGDSDHVIQHTGGFTYTFLQESDGGTFVQTAAEGATGSLLSLDYINLGFPDLNGDGKADIAIQHFGGFTYAFLQNGITEISRGSIAGLPSTDYVTVGFPDLNGDEFSDHLVRYTGGGGYTYAYLTGPDTGNFVETLASGQVAGPPSNSYADLGQADLNCDGRADLVYQHTGGFTIAHLSGASGLMDSSTQGELPTPNAGEANRGFEAPWAALP